MNVERLILGSALFGEVLGMLPGYFREVEGFVRDKETLRLYLSGLVDHGHVYCVPGGGFMVVDRCEDLFHRDGGYWIILMAYVVPEKRRSSILSHLLKAVRELHKGEIRAMSYRGNGADPVMARRFNHIGNVYIL
ncbi:MAG: hypothetical protein K4305_09015 [Chlorobium sp.]|uniref:hypothetical protein n=1 Tax=Chlorobium sp. TaxID=1095 RepID=UPI002F3F2578